MTEYTHKGVTIRFNEGSADFTASVGGQSLHSPSMTGIKRRIDKIKKDLFEPFDALMFPNYYGAKVTPIKVLSVRHGGRHWNQNGFVYHAPEGYDSVARVLVPDTPEARAAIEEYLEVSKEENEIMNKMREKRDAAMKKIPRIEFDQWIRAKAKE